MKANIHPAYGDVKVMCSCGHEFIIQSTLGHELRVDVCNKCHPFYSGKQKIVDTAGRVERFKKMFGDE